MSEPRPRTQHWTPNPDPTSIVVPGVDVTASINDQIDQIDQLITIRLQNIDGNFSRIQHLIATKLLPAFKRYAEATEPVREAAKFWKSFYEAAAQVRIPIASETSSLYQNEDDPEEQNAVDMSSHDPNVTPTNANPPDDSFIRDAPISSTPLLRDPTTVTLPKDEDESWAASIESPFERLGRQVRDLAREEPAELTDYPSTSSAPSFSPLHGSYTGAVPGNRTIQSMIHSTQPGSEVPSTLSSRKGKTPLRQSVLRQNASSSRQWNGLVDLRQPSSAKSRGWRTPGPSSSKGDSITNGYHSDSSDDLFPPGMSPPVTMQFAMGSRARASPVKLAPTPARKAAERIGRDLVAKAVNKATDKAKYLPSSMKPPGSHTSRKRTGTTNQLHNPVKAPEAPSFPSDSDSDSSEHDESNPSAGFLFATQNNARTQADDSFASSQQSTSSDENEDDAVRAARHPLAHIFVGGTQGVEDSFDQSFAPVEEETVFGARLVGQQSEARPTLTLMRDALIDDTNPGAVSLNPLAQVEQTPTPYIRELKELN